MNLASKANIVNVYLYLEFIRNKSQDKFAHICKYISHISDF